jgi:uncharacterized membrane protein
VPRASSSTTPRSADPQCSFSDDISTDEPALLLHKGSTAPLAVAVVGSLAAALITIPLAHGGGLKTLSALLGTAVSLLLTAGLAVLFTELTHLTGLSSEEAAFLQLGQPDLSLEGLLLAGMVIGALGVLDDVTISQASTILALRRANPSFRFRELFGRAREVGRDHVSATVNTLVLAYSGPPCRFCCPSAPPTLASPTR